MYFYLMRNKDIYYYYYHYYYYYRQVFCAKLGIAVHE